MSSHPEPRASRGHPEPRAAPGATYRLQLQPAFGFDAAADLAGYLARLGVTHLYASPYLQAAPGSVHGYDVVDHTRVNDELGGPAAHQRMCSALGDAGLGQVLDIVPNHMAVVTGNAWWWDVLENGPSSQYASYFDVDWDPPEEYLRNTVLMPILGDHYGRVLEAGEITLTRDGAAFTIRYFEHALPVAPRSLDNLLAGAAAACGSAELESLASAFGRLPPSWAIDRDSLRERHRDKEVLRDRLADLLAGTPEVGEAIDAELARINGDPDALDALLERQNYRLAFWRIAGQELDYRRFFDINTLAALRVEDDGVFDDTHRLVLAWAGAGVIDGLRIDHPDGLVDPQGYLRRLQERTPGDTWVVVEKILEAGEQLPASWPVAGTTGYDFAALATGVLVDPAGEESLTAAYTAFLKAETDWREMVIAKKHLVMRDVLSAEVNRLTVLAVEVCERHRRYRDYTRRELAESLRELIAAFPVYRTYITPGTTPGPADVAHVEEAVKLAAERRPDLDAELIEFLGSVLLGRHPSRRAAGDPPVPVEDQFVVRFQQVTGPVMAKGVEDTAFYCYNRLLCLNEVGGSAGRFGVSVEDLHRHHERIHATWPRTMLTLSTHDTKRSGDVRARLALLAEIPETFAEAVAEWTGHNKRHRTGPDRPDRNIEWLLYQTLVGAWPLSVERALAYTEKCAKEAKEHTSWIDPDPDYDEALRRFVTGVLADAEFVASLERFVAGLIPPGRVNALTQTLLLLTAPGIPDLYQGSELWDLSLVDPDNRRPVDWELRRRLLDEIEAGLSAADAWARPDEGLPKLFLIHRGLRLRRRRRRCFGPGPAGAYRPLTAGGPRAGHVIAYSRGGDVIAVAPRLVLGVAGGWEGTTLPLPPGVWTDVVDGTRTLSGPVAVADLLAPFPVALLERAS